MPEKVPETEMQATQNASYREPLAQAVTSLGQAATGREHLTLQEITHAVGTHGPCLAAVLLVLPFLQPIPMMGLSTPVGLAICISGIGLALNREVVLPKRISSARFPVTSILKMTEYLARFESKLKPYLKSDAGLDSLSIHRFLGVLIAIHGFLLALPLPVPFSNALPAWMCFFSALTVLFASRRLFVISILALIANIVFWAGLLAATIWGSHSLVEWLGVKF